MRFFPAALFVAALFISHIAASAKADAVPARTVSTSGEAIVYVTPDEVVVNFGIQIFDENLDKAKAKNDEESAKLVKAIRALGIEDKRIQTDSLQVSVEYKDNRVSEGFRGYVTQRGYSIELKDTKLFEKLVDTGLKNGANQLNGFVFCTTQLRKYRDQARALAVKAAKEKAVALAKELDCGVGKPWQISEASNGYGGGNSAMYNNAQNEAQVAPGGGEESGTLPLGQIAIRASVAVVFDLTTDK